MTVAALNPLLFTRPDTDRTWTLPASLVDTGKHTISAVTLTEYPESLLNDTYNLVAHSLSITHFFAWHSLPPQDHALRPFFENTSTFTDAIRPITKTRLLKTVENYMFKTYQVRLHDTIRDRISTHAAKHTQAISDRIVDYTTAFDWRPGDFGDHGSCYWNPSYFNHSRVNVLPRLGAMAMRAWDKSGGGTGRAWVIPAPRAISPDFPTFQVMNAYGSLKDLEPHPAQILARHLSDVTGINWHVPRNTYFNVNDAHCNGDSMIVTPADATLPSAWTGAYYDRPTLYASNVDLPRPEWAINDRHARVRCAECEEYFSEDDLDGDNLCEDCARDAEEERNKVTCDCCGARVSCDNAYNIEDGDTTYCEDCYNEYAVYIERLDYEVHRDDVVWIRVGGVDMPYLQSEYNDTWTICDVSAKIMLTENIVEVEDADATVYAIDAALAKKYCATLDGHVLPVIVTPLGDDYVRPTYANNRDIYNLLSWSDWQERSNAKAPRALHWLDLPANYTPPAPADNLTIEMTFA